MILPPNKSALADALYLWLFLLEVTWLRFELEWHCVWTMISDHCHTEQEAIRGCGYYCFFYRKSSNKLNAMHDSVNYECWLNLNGIVCVFRPNHKYGRCYLLSGMWLTCVYQTVYLPTTLWRCLVFISHVIFVYSSL